MSREVHVRFCERPEVRFLRPTHPSLMFCGAGGESLGRHGKSKDHRPELKQVIVGVVIDAEGRPICSETWPGNATDVKALLPVVRRLRERFGIGRMCVVADRGMISAETIAELERRAASATSRPGLLTRAAYGGLQPAP